MGSSIPVGTIAGINVRVDTTMLLLFLLFAWQGFAIAGLAGAIGQTVFLAFLFLSVLLHEFGHAMGARAFGIQTKDVTLHFFGGYARLSQEPRRPIEEGAIALAGPTVNLAIAGALYAFLPVAAKIAWLAPYLNLISTLQYANLLLAVFNLLPGFPLDGGSVMRAFLSMWLPRPQARLIVGYLGILIGFGLAAWGFPNSFLTITLGLLLVFMASMEVAAARRSPGSGDPPG